jgi:hypothetical protein
MTTEEFIYKAQDVHGGKYDYSKVEYVSNKTKVCIICPQHGEFWQSPEKHLKGQGCSKCRYVSLAERFSHNKETFIEKANNIHNGFYDYSKVEYVNSHLHVIINCPLHGIFKQKPASHLSGCGCPKCSREKTIQRRKIWTKELVEAEAKKYTSKYDFYTGSKNAYGAAVKYGWLDVFDWLEEIKKPNGYWTKNRCREEALKYTTKKDFLEGCPSAHAAAAKRGWLEEFVWLIDNRIDTIKDKIDSVYVYIFEDAKVAYVGRTLIRRQKKRDKEHIFNRDSDNVARYAKKHHIPVPKMTILETDLTLKEGLEREDYWRKWYEQQGYAMLNKSATGIGKGSLGAISHGKWSRRRCYEEAQKYKSISEFENANASACIAARRNGWLDDYVWFVKLWEPKWDKETCYKEAEKYKTRSEFQKGCPVAYSKALKKGWIFEYVWLTSRNQKPQGYWTYEHCYEEAKKFSSRKNFEDHCKSGYLKAVKHGWIDDYTWFKEKQKHNYWNRETCFEEAKKYKTATEFARNTVRAYELARANGWMEDYTWFEKPFRWTKDLCEEEARKYTKRSHFKKGSPAAYANARDNGWLDDYTWFEEKPRMNYWNKETCYEEAKRYKTRTEFQKGNASAYAVALKNGWIDEYEWLKPPLHIWTYEDCKKEAAKYERRTQFKKALPGAYKKAREQSWLDDFFPKNKN